jgi:alpha-galactosidase/6-phospho-beta-glucosidase family protein
VIVGGGSHQWVPPIVSDIVRTPSLAGAELVLDDIDPDRLLRLGSFAEHASALGGARLTVSTTTDQRAALDGADAVVVNISTGGFDSMRHDLEVPERYGIRQSVGDTVGPGGVNRALRNIPVLSGIAADMVELCPDALLVNLTNPMTALCRAVTSQTPLRVVGLCHELTLTRFYLSLLLDVGFEELELTVTGVNHLPIITAVDAAGADGLAQLTEVVSDRARLAEPLPAWLPELPGHGPRPQGGWTKADLVAINQVKLELFARFGALPGAGDRHVVEFFPGFLTEDSEWGKRWGVELTSIEDRQRDEATYRSRTERLLAATELPGPSGELVAPLLDSLVTGTRRTFPANLPNVGQSPDLPPGVVVESICAADGTGVQAQGPVSAPPLLAEWLRRVSASQELTVQAALTGDRSLVLAALLADPLAGRMDFERLDQMASELLAATEPWLPQFDLG